MAKLCDLTCGPCKGGTPPIKGPQLEQLHRQVSDWEVVDEHHLQRQFKFPDFASALAFVNRVGELAEQQGHHPDVELSWGKAVVKLHTHKIGGLSENDFIMAARIDQLPRD